MKGRSMSSRWNADFFCGCFPPTYCCVCPSDTLLDAFHGHYADNIKPQGVSNRSREPITGAPNPHHRLPATCVRPKTYPENLWTPFSREAGGGEGSFAGSVELLPHGACRRPGRHRSSGRARAFPKAGLRWGEESALALAASLQPPASEMGGNV